jgi:hypothetical protein
MVSTGVRVAVACALKSCAFQADGDIGISIALDKGGKTCSIFFCAALLLWASLPRVMVAPV